MKNENKTVTYPQLDYWKKHITMHHVLACELSYSLLYNNIRPEKVQEALATVGLDRLPNRFFLIQVDDYFNYSDKMQITQEFYQKTVLINQLREYMNTLEVQGFLANLVGVDKIVCYLCCEERENDSIRGWLYQIAEGFKEHVRSNSDYTVSICISQRCSRIGQYSQMHPKMELALNRSYFSGKEFSIFLEDVEEEMPKKAASLKSFYPQCLAAISRGNLEQMENILQEVMKVLLESDMSPDSAKRELIRLQQRLSDYGMRCGIPQKEVKKHSDLLMKQILSQGFVADVRVYLMNFFVEMTRLLHEVNTEEDYLFKIPVCEYIEAHYMEDIRLENVADVIGFSQGHFTRVFKEEFGKTFVQYLTECRIEHSKELLLTTSVPIEEIAYRVGINSYSYFCTCFKKVCKVSPGEFRKNSGK